MKFVLYPECEAHLDAILDALSGENVIYKIQTERTDLGIFGSKLSLSVICDTTYDKLEFIKYLVDKKKQQLGILEKSYSLPSCTHKNIESATKKDKSENSNVSNPLDGLDSLVLSTCILGDLMPLLQEINTPLHKRKKNKDE